MILDKMMPKDRNLHREGRIGIIAAKASCRGSQSRLGQTDSRQPSQFLGPHTQNRFSDQEVVLQIKV